MLQMNQKSITTILAHLNLYVFTFLFLSDHCFCIDPYHEACVPKDCGNGLQISYPFYIHDQQQSYCGYPGFKLNCTSNGFPILHIPDNDYIVQDIDYTDQSLRVYNGAITNNLTNGCFPSIRNVTFDRSSVFRMENYSNVVLLSDCLDDQLDERWRSYRVGCNVSRGGVGLAMLESDGNLGLAKEECGVNVVAPVEWKGGNERIEIGSWSYYEELLRRGFLLKWTAGDCSVCESSGGRCGFNETSFHFRCFCPDRPHNWSCRTRPQRKVKLALAIGTSAVGVLIVVILLCCFWRKWSFCKWTFSICKIRKDDENIEALLKKYGSLAPERYRYSDIKKMTNSFKEKLGQGGYGGVYKGMLPDGRIVAVKILNKPKGSGEDFVNEVTSISRTSHVNIVSLLGFCFEGSKRALIYEFMPNGSLDRFIYNDKSGRGCQLGWEKLNEIALGIARGLEYLHRGCNIRIVHFDIKPHNILLNEEFFPKISDFGLAKLCPEKKSIVSMSGMRGTPGYVAPELFFRNYGGASHKSDVYSYGMMLLEMIGGRKNIEVEVDNPDEKYSEVYFPDWLYNRLEKEKGIRLDGNMDEDEDLRTRKMIIVGLWCIQTDPTDRPSMTKVVEMLEGSVESLQIPPKPVLVNSPRCEEYSSATHS